MRAKLFLLLGILCVASGCATYQHPDFNARHAKVASIAVLPVSLEVYRVTFSGDKDPMHDTAAEANLVAEDEIVNVLKKKGYEVQPFNSSEEALSQRPEVRTAWHTTKELCVKALGEIQKGKKGKTPYSVGEDANILADYANADSLVFLIGESAKKTGGEIAREVVLRILFGAPIQPNETLAQLAVVESDTGEILWVNRNPNTGVNPGAPDQIRRMIQDMLSLFPKSASEQNREKTKQKERMETPAAAPQNFGTRPPAAVP